MILGSWDIRLTPRKHALSRRSANYLMAWHVLGDVTICLRPGRMPDALLQGFRISVSREVAMAIVRTAACNLTAASAL